MDSKKGALFCNNSFFCSQLNHSRLRQAAAFYHALRSGFHSAASLALKSKTEIRCAHNRFAALLLMKRKNHSHLHHFHKDRRRRDKTSRLYKRAGVFYFSLACSYSKTLSIAIFIFPLHKGFILTGTCKGYMNSAAHRSSLRCPLQVPFKIKCGVYEVR